MGCLKALHICSFFGVDNYRHVLGGRSFAPGQYLHRTPKTLSKTFGHLSIYPLLSRFEMGNDITRYHLFTVEKCPHEHHTCGIGFKGVHRGREPSLCTPKSELFSALLPVKGVSKYRPHGNGPFLVQSGQH